MTQSDVYSEAIDAVCEYYTIDRDVCIEHFWDEVECYMQLKIQFRIGDLRNDNDR